MIDLPKPGSPVYVWPQPGLKVQDGPLSISDGGRWLPQAGRSVIWDEHRYRQLLAGELHLTDPAPATQLTPKSAPAADATAASVPSRAPGAAPSQPSGTEKG
jgi:hypothetical protein